MALTRLAGLVACLHERCHCYCESFLPCNLISIELPVPIRRTFSFLLIHLGFAFQSIRASNFYLMRWRQAARGGFSPGLIDFEIRIISRLPSSRPTV
ncbi:unnamed protein product [Protopolystoma xenopodis]|uniref:Uncharacterized protein n=1 Tax=Protopolystoma xenopodis TaxID=117903 RepID=A0A448X7M8_9PLAT|nr:unnamed protein product [Protopolystoma xenopodis]